MCSEPLPKEFESTSEVLPLTNYGLSTLENYKKGEEAVQRLEWLRKVGLTHEQIKLYQDDVAGLLDQRQKIESSVLASQLDAIYKKINDFQNKALEAESSDQPSSSSSSQKPATVESFQNPQKTQTKTYPEGHPMHELKDLEDELYDNSKEDDVIPITKRRKILRRLERKKERILNQGLEVGTVPNVSKQAKSGNLWDVNKTNKVRPSTSKSKEIEDPIIMYTIRHNKIVRLDPPVKEEEPVRREEQCEDEAEDVVTSTSTAEEQLLEGTKMSIDNIKKIEQFKDYEPGIPSKVLYLKNIAPAVSQEQLSLLFNQFVLDNGGPAVIRLMTGRMRGQAFVEFRSEDVAIQALEEINGTILSGRPVIALFGRNSNRIDENR